MSKVLKEIYHIKTGNGITMVPLQYCVIPTGVEFELGCDNKLSNRINLTGEANRPPADHIS
jgi:hypothetical protein